MPAFAVAELHRGSDVVVSVTGELDVATVGELERAVQRALEFGPAVVLDLTDCAFIDSRGCRLLVFAGKAGPRSGTPVMVVAPPANLRVRRVLDMIQLGSVMPVLDRLHAATPLPL